MEKDVGEIKWRVDGIEKSVDLLIRANRKQLINDLLEFFGRSKDKVKVFLKIDGEKTVDQITKELEMKKPNVSKRITELQDEGLVKIKGITRQGYVYEKTEKVRILNLEKILRKKFSIEAVAPTTCAETEMGEKPER